MLPPLRDPDIEDRRSNFLLDLLSTESLSSIQPHLSRISLVKSQLLFEDNHPLDHVFFLESGLAVLIADTGDDSRVQVGMVGREGFAGTVSLFDDDLKSIHTAEMQIAGTAFRMPQVRFQEALESLPDFKLLCLRHTKATTLQMSQLAACNARHSLSQRLCRLLLMVQDRTGDTALILTQGELALMLGVRRAGVSAAVTSLETSQIVRQTRCCIEIIDHAKLSYETCDCYHIIKNRRNDIMRIK